MRKRKIAAIVALLIVALLAGWFAASAVSVGPAAVTTVTIDVATGPQGPPGPPGPAFACPTGFVLGDVVINAPGGKVTLFTCLLPG